MHCVAFIINKKTVKLIHSPWHVCVKCSLLWRAAVNYSLHCHRAPVTLPLGLVLQVVFSAWSSPLSDRCFRASFSTGLSVHRCHLGKPRQLTGIQWINLPLSISHSTLLAALNCVNLFEVHFLVSILMLGFLKNSFFVLLPQCRILLPIQKCNKWIM